MANRKVGHMLGGGTFQAGRRTLTLAMCRWHPAAPRLYTAGAIGDVLGRPRAYVARWLLIPYVVVPPAPATPVPVVPPVFRNGMAAMPSCLAVQGLLTAIHHAHPTTDGWQRADDGRPSFAFAKRAGTIITSVSPPCDAPPLREAVASLWQTTKELTDLDGDVLLAALCQAMVGGPDTMGQAVWLTADALLDYRGIVPKIHRDGSLRHRAGHRAEDRAHIAASMDRLDRLWVRLREVEVMEPRGRAKPRRARYTHESKVLVITDRLLQDGVPIAWRYSPGAWLAPFLTIPNRQVALLMQQALRYDPYRQRWEKRLARYLTCHLRMDAKNGRLLVRCIGPLLDELHLPVDQRHPERTRGRFETALHRLARDGVIDGWDYTGEARDVLATLPSRGWVDWWRGTTVIITPPRAIQERYASISSTPMYRAGS